MAWGICDNCIGWGFVYELTDEESMISVNCWMCEGTGGIAQTDVVVDEVIQSYLKDEKDA